MLQEHNNVAESRSYGVFTFLCVCLSYQNKPIKLSNTISPPISRHYTFTQAFRFENTSFIHYTNHFLLFHGTTAPSGSGSPQNRGFTITLRHTSQSEGILWTSDRTNAEKPTWQHTTFTRDRERSPRRYSNPAIPGKGRPQTHTFHNQ